MAITEEPTQELEQLEAFFSSIFQGRKLKKHYIEQEQNAFRAVTLTFENGDVDSYFLKPYIAEALRAKILSDQQHEERLTRMHNSDFWKKEEAQLDRIAEKFFSITPEDWQVMRERIIEKMKDCYGIQR